MGEKTFYGRLFLILGPSGSGKGSIVNALKKRYSGFLYPVSMTTRKIRPKETDGDQYNFVSKEKFEEMIEKEEFLEYAEYSGQYYGIPKAPIYKGLEVGAMIIREVEMQGFDKVREIIPKENLVSIFIDVEDEADLRGRIAGRGELSEEELNMRMERARAEIAQADNCSHRVPNPFGKLNNTIRDVEKIILDELDNMY